MLGLDVSILLHSAFVFLGVLECMLIIFIQGVPYILTWLLPMGNGGALLQISGGKEGMGELGH
jgi:hypothetical protein